MMFNKIVKDCDLGNTIIFAVFWMQQEPETKNVKYIDGIGHSTNLKDLKRKTCLRLSFAWFITQTSDSEFSIWGDHLYFRILECFFSLKDHVENQWSTHNNF